MKRFLTLTALAFAFAAPAAAQTSVRPDCEDGFEVITIPDGGGTPVYDCAKTESDLFGKERAATLDYDASGGAEKPVEIGKPDYSKLSEDAERTAKLDDLFAKLKRTLSPEDANLVAEEIWAVWLDSGSASVNFLTRRGTAAQKSGNIELARRMFDQVTLLEPGYAEGWSRSGRLAIEEDDLNRALVDTTQALVYEPRHFYALWTLGNIFERLGRTEEAFEAYSEAHKLYPGLKAVEDQMTKLSKDVEGDVL